MTVVPHERARVGRVGIPCKRPTCSSVIEPNESGRPKDFCTKSCKERFHREARKALQQLREELRAAQAYGHRYTLVAQRDTEPVASDPATMTRPSLDSGAASAAGGDVASSNVGESDPSPAGAGAAETLGPGAASPGALHEKLLKDLLHEVGIALAQLDGDQDESTAVWRRLSRRRNDIFLQLASLEE